MSSYLVLAVMIRKVILRCQTYLLAINYVPELGFAIAVENVAAVEIALIIPRLRVCFGIVVILPYYSRTTNADFATSVKRCDVVAFFIYKSVISSALLTNKAVVVRTLRRCSA
jgi:hypothetical protein